MLLTLPDLDHQKRTERKSLIGPISEHNSSIPSFPRWDSKCIEIDPMLEFIRQLLFKGKNQVSWEGWNWFGHKAYHVVLYFIDENGTLFVNNRMRQRHNSQVPGEQRRIVAMENNMLASLVSLQRGGHFFQFPRLSRILQEGGIPLLIFLGDFKGCNHENFVWQNSSHSIPFFTLCARLDCRYAFPVPDYEVADIAYGNFTSSIIANSSEKEQIPMAIWRGKFSQKENLVNNTRYQLYLLSKKDNFTSLDARFTEMSLPRFSQQLRKLQRVPKIPLHEFQNYRIVVDIDGNSWSSRFPKLLCLKSVVVKVQPVYVFYLHPSLEPYRHYIPATLENIIPTIAHILSNQSMAQSIIQNANAWCQQRVATPTSVQHDTLRTLEFYAGKLDAAQRNWSYLWRTKRDEWVDLFSVSPRSRFVRVEDLL